MTEQQQRIFTRITEYAEAKLDAIDPEKVRISEQLTLLKPIMEEIASEENMKLEDVFILYMDLASNAAVEMDKKFKEDFADLNHGNDFFIQS